MHKILKSFAVAAGLASLVGCHHSGSGLADNPDDEKDGGLPHVILTPDDLYHVTAVPSLNPENPCPTTSFTGEALYCLRRDIPLGGRIRMGSEHFGVYVDLIVSDPDGLEKVGTRFDSGSVRYAVSDFGGATSYSYLFARRNLPAPHGLNPEVYAVDLNGNETSVQMSEVDCNTLDALLGW